MTHITRRHTTVSISPKLTHRKRTLPLVSAGIAAAMLLGSIPVAQATDTLPWDQTDPKYAAGDHQPYNHGYNGEDILNWSPAKDVYASQLRARVPLQTRIGANPATQRNPNLPADTEMFNLAGDYGNAFFESFHDNNVFSQYLFNYWQYTDYYGTWHGQPTQGVDKALYDTNKDWTQKWFEFGSMNLPNPAYTNAAHKNGAKSIATIFFSDNDRGEQTYRDLLKNQDDDGRYLVADKLVEIAQYFGFDGYFINQESDVSAQDIDAYKDFIHQVNDQGIYIQWYDSAVDGSGKVDYQNMFNEANAPWIQDGNKGKIADSIFLNYWYHANMLKDSAALAKSLGRDPKQSVFAGIEAGKEKFDNISANADYMKVNLDESGKPYVSLAALGTDFVSHELGDDKKVYPEYQNEVFDRERRLWTGSSTGDGSDETDGWKGFSSQIAERSVIGGPVFSTTFNTGHGLEWRDAGKVTSDQEWGNINLQDVPVTWQWWIDADSDPLQADFDYGEHYTSASRFKYHKLGAYEGGNSLVLSGKLSSDNTVRLFKTDLDVTDSTKVDVTYRKPASDDSSLKLGVVLANDPQNVVPVDIVNGGATSGWQTVSVDLSQFAGQNIETLGLIAAKGADTVDDYQINIGKLTFTDGSSHTPAAPSNVRLNKLFVDTQEAQISWDMAKYDDVQNYLVYLDNTFIGGRYDDNLYIKHLPATSGTLKVVAVGADGSRSEAAQVPFDLAHSAGNITAEANKDGNFSATWSKPNVGNADSENGDTTVTLTSADGSWRYSDNPYSATQTVAADKDGVQFDGVPVDGSRYTLTLTSPDGSVSSVEDVFADATIEPYPVCSVSWNDDATSVTLVRPEIQDWRYIYITEQWQEGGETHSEDIGAEYTYSQDTPPITGIIRGRTKPTSYTVTPQHGGDILVSYEDYRGNVTEPVKIPSNDGLGSCALDDSAQPNADTSQLEALPGEAIANGKETRSVRAAVKDTFGNPQIDSPVAFALPEALSAIRDNEAVDSSDMATGSDGTVVLSMTSTTPGTFTVTGSLLSGDVIGDGASVEFKPVADSGGTEPSPDPDNLQPGLEPGYDPDPGADLSPSPQPSSGDHLSNTGSNILIAAIAVLVLVAVGGTIVIIRKRRNQVLFGEVSN